MAVRFQVEPDFYDHPKSIGLSDAATALWARAGSYSAAKLSDGFIAEHALALLSRTPEEASAELVARGLWRRTRGGYQFHQWGQHGNLLRAQVEAEREADRIRKAAKRLEAKGASVRAESGGSPGGQRKESGRSPTTVVLESVLESKSGRRPGRTPKRLPAPHAYEGDDPNTCAACPLPPEHEVHADGQP